MDDLPISFPNSFYFVRHGTTDHNQARLVMGRRDVSFNEEGHCQALVAAHLLQGRNIRTIMASSLARARETAEIIATVLGISILLESGLMERAWGIYEDHDRILRPLHDEPTGGETLRQFSDRTLRDSNLMSGRPGPMLVVAHDGTCRVLRSYFGISGLDAVMPNASPIYYEYTGHGWREQLISAVQVILTIISLGPMGVALRAMGGRARVLSQPAFGYLGWIVSFMAKTKVLGETMRNASGL